MFAWFAAHGRDLPWRRTTDPYAIALSEIMLQQTQVDRVIPKWRAFLDAFPTWHALAEAKQSDVIRLWKGLGYNRRAVMLHRLAKTVVHAHNGMLPQSIDALKRLPGIGSYTAHAIAAFAFRDRSAAPVDTNIARILRRVFPRGKFDAPSLQRLALAVSPRDVWTWNHALMDIGALHCMARHHEWALCPLAELHGSRAKAELWLQKKAGERFATSDRYFRGRIVDALREGPMTLRSLQKRPVFIGLNDERFTTLIKGVVKDGIAIRKNGKVFLHGDE